MPVFDNNHGAVVEISDALTGLLAVFDDLNAHCLAGDNHGLDGVRQVVDVQNFDAAQLSDFVQIKVVRDNLAAEFLRQSHEL